MLVIRVEKGENKQYKLTFSPFSTMFSMPLKKHTFSTFNPLPDIPIIDSSKSTANKDIMPNILTNWDTIF